MVLQGFLKFFKRLVMTMFMFRKLQMHNGFTKMVFKTILFKIEQGEKLNDF